MVYQKPISPPESTCSNVVECAVTNPDPVALALLVAAAGVVLLVVTLALAHIASARSLLEEERKRVAAEAEAFGAFARRVADVDTASTPVTDGGPTGTTTLSSARPADGLETVREAYRDTVMGVPHYEEEYDEALPTNMRLEFGEDVAEAVDRGPALTPQLRATLVERSRTARSQRLELHRQLAAEAEALEDAQEALERCRNSAARIEAADLDEQTFDDLVAEWRLLTDRQDAAEAVLEGRQETVQTRERENKTRGRGPSFEEYLYEPLETTYPVLSTGTDLIDRLDRARNRVERAIASRS